MMNIGTLLLTMIFMMSSLSAMAQTDKETAAAKVQEGIKLEDEQGKYDEAIKLFEEAEKLDPDNINYPYEVAYAYTSKKEYKSASDILEKLLVRKDVFARVYQALGNNYDYEGNPEKAIATYEAGLKIFPNSGNLYLELGNMHLPKKEYNKALEYYEKGIEKDPQYPSNYYWAGKIFCNSSDKEWGLIYGEIFMNLERNSRRTQEISKLIFDTYKDAIVINKDSMNLKFCDAVMDVKDLTGGGKVKFPFCMIYGKEITLALITVEAIDINSLGGVRSRFLDEYYKGKDATDYPNVLFDYQKKVRDAGHLEAYNYWILSQGDLEGFKKWQAANEGKWSDFTTWLTNNAIQIDDTHRFYRRQY